MCRKVCRFDSCQPQALNPRFLNWLGDYCGFFFLSCFLKCVTLPKSSGNKTHFGMLRNKRNMKIKKRATQEAARHKNIFFKEKDRMKLSGKIINNLNSCGYCDIVWGNRNPTGTLQTISRKQHHTAFKAFCSRA